MPGGLRCRPEHRGAALSCAETISLWHKDEGFCAALSGWLAALPYVAFRWECAPFAAGALNRPFEFVVLDAPSLAIPADPHPFAAHLARADAGSVITFENLSRDALLVAPRARATANIYASLAPFVRGAPASQVRALWLAVAEALRLRLGPAPVWLSTAGDGVAWLHVRLDRRPKYFAWADYRNAALTVASSSIAALASCSGSDGP